MGAAARLVDRFPVKIPVFVPAVLLQFIHEDDVGRALLQCIAARAAHWVMPTGAAIGASPMDAGFVAVMALLHVEWVVAKAVLGGARTLG